MSATVANDRVYRAFLGPDLSEKTFYHGHSYGGNALAAAVALRHLELFKRWNVLDNVRARATQLRDALVERVRTKRGVREIRQCGLMAAIDLENESAELRLARRTSTAMVRRGVLARSLGSSIILVPPLTITAEEIDRIVATLRVALDEVLV
jgi:adenosylmethionine-8-amino-7-oxononanoate aminotransferase